MKMKKKKTKKVETACYVFFRDSFSSSSFSLFLSLSQFVEWSLLPSEFVLMMVLLNPPPPYLLPQSGSQLNKPQM